MATFGVRSGAFERAVKYGLESALAALILVVSAPIWIAAAVAVRCSGPGPVLFRQTRVGRGGAPITVLKFRTMVDGADRMVRSDADDWHRYTVNGFKLARDDRRITRVGRVLRAWSIDELPQLVNVLRGEMTLVGVRPLLPEELALRPEHDQALYRSMRPGLTGLWQVEGRSSITGVDRLLLDRRYLEERSLRGDLGILARTPVALLRSESAH
jgi:lipopolysaccharide/colanic/teichoic acid biosynthesis glycosyltransferase